MRGFSGTPLLSFPRGRSRPAASEGPLLCPRAGILPSAPRAQGCPWGVSSHRVTLGIGGEPSAFPPTVGLPCRCASESWAPPGRLRALLPSGLVGPLHLAWGGEAGARPGAHLAWASNQERRLSPVGSGAAPSRPPRCPSMRGGVGQDVARNVPKSQAAPPPFPRGGRTAFPLPARGLSLPISSPSFGPGEQR